MFDRDRFIDGMLTLRQIGEHVIQEKRPGRTKRFQITIEGNRPIDLDHETSAMGAFPGQEATVYDIYGTPYRINHLQRLRDAETRIRRALEKARSIAG